MKEIKERKFTGERALFSQSELSLENCIFADGESPLKHSERIKARKCSFEWKYPFWYSRNLEISNSVFHQMARAGLWYCKNLKFNDVLFEAPKGFRRSSNIKLKDVNLTDAAETLWHCKDVSLENVSAKGDYFAMNCENLKIEKLNLVGNYCFDGCKNLTIKDSKLLSKDAFWNCEDIYAQNCIINGEYLGWNSKNITLVDCTITSLQGMCYIENLIMRGCVSVDTTLAYEYSSVDAEMLSDMQSVKNPLSGRIKAKDIKELIMDEKFIDPTKTQIIIG